MQTASGTTQSLKTQGLSPGSYWRPSRCNASARTPSSTPIRLLIVWSISLGTLSSPHSRGFVSSKASTLTSNPLAKCFARLLSFRISRQWKALVSCSSKAGSWTNRTSFLRMWTRTIKEGIYWSSDRSMCRFVLLSSIPSWLLWQNKYLHRPPGTNPIQFQNPYFQMIPPHLGWYRIYYRFVKYL